MGRRLKIWRAGFARAFSMLELMIVLGILAIIASILLPTASKLREKAREAKCASNLHQVASAFFCFAAEHDRRLPGGVADEFDPDPEHHDWLMGNPHDFLTAPQGGTIYKYVQTTGVFRCPSSNDNPPGPGSGFGPGTGSNGRFDYAAIESFSGAFVGSISMSSRVRQLPIDPTLPSSYEDHPTPLIVEKDEIYINGVELNSSHCSNFTMTHRHHGGAQYAAVDGSVTWVNEPQSDKRPRGCQLWETTAPSGVWVSLGSIRARWGSWGG